MTKQQLLALHYIYPITVPIYQRVIQLEKTIDEFMVKSSSHVAALLGVPITQAQNIQQMYKQVREIDLMTYYAEHQITVICYMDIIYPQRLLHIYDAPAILYVKGQTRLLNAEKSIACIGSRDATSYSAEILKQLIPPLVEAQYVIVSGLAKGADTLAHKAAIYYGGKTIAVLGHGFQTIYPASNQKLAQILSKNHLLVTEYAPHFAPKKVHFPQRNRIICGLTQGLIVTEAAERSGTMITAEFALEQGKDIFAAPGPITSVLSAGTNKLIKEGAIPVWNGYQITQELQLFQIKN